MSADMPKVQNGFRDPMPKSRLFPAGFTYRPPIESMCPCGTKHTGSSYLCPICQREDNVR